MDVSMEECLRIEPSSDARVALARAVASFGNAARGQYQLEWVEDRPSGGCLCFTQKNVRGKTAVCVEIRNADDTPRQATLDDVEDFKRQIHRRLNNADWVKEHYSAKEEAKKRQKAERRDIAEQTVKELINLSKNRVMVDYGQKAEEQDIPEGGYRVIDRRPNYEATT